MNTIIEKIRAEVERLKEEGDIALQDAVETYDIESGFVCGGIISTCEKLLTKLDTLQEQPVMIEWTGNNLKEVIEFTGKSPRFDEWFKTWDEYESYVHSHGNIFKLFNEDGTHLEVPVGAWIFKTPDGRNVPSTFLCKEQPVCEGVEEEILNSYDDSLHERWTKCPYTIFQDIARHFAQWGAEHRGSSEKPNDLEDAAKSHRSTASYGGDINLAMEDSYKEGALWMREQMLKEAVEVTVIEMGLNPSPYIIHGLPRNFKEGDKVKLIIKDDTK